VKGLITVIAVLVVLGLAYFLYRTPTGSPEMTKAEIAQIEAEVRQAATDQMNTWIAQEDLDAHVADHSGWAGNPWGGTRTLEQMRDRQEALWARWDYEPVSPPDWEVWVLAPDVAAVKGTVQLTRTDTAGVVQTYLSDWAHVWIIEEGEWKILLAKEAAEVIED
jgi:hypothetical protein